jgi:ABC-2 type transport system ATP-binding protein
MAETAIYTENLARHFGAVRAVDDLSLEVPAGMVFGFLGPNGAGKTTTIHLLLGLLAPTAGRAEVLGFETRQQGQAVRARTGVLLEHAGLYEQLSAEDNLEFYGRVARLPAGERRRRIEEALDDMDLWDRRHERVKQWSRGMKQRLAVARAMLHRPQLLFLDEPTVGLDVLAATALRDDLSALVARHGITVFLTTHNMPEAERLCDRVAVIRDGRLVDVGPPDELRAKAGRPNLEEAFLVMMEN